MVFHTKRRNLIRVFGVVVSSLFLGSACAKNTGQDLTQAQKDPWKMIYQNGELDFSVKARDFRVPVNIQEISEDARKTVKNKCARVYKKSLSGLDEAIADAAVKSFDVHNIVVKLNRRLFQLLEAHASVRAEKNGTDKNREMDALLNEVMGNCGPRNAGCLGGKVPLVRETFKIGNLRERMFLQFLTQYQYVGKLLVNPSELAEINKKLQKKGWALKADPPNPAIPFEPGIYAKIGRFRRERSPSKIRKYVLKRGTTIADGVHNRIPFSPRELDFFQGRGFGLESLDPTLPGAAFFDLSFDDDHPYLVNAKRAMIPLMAGISGTMDSMLTQFHYLGITDMKELHEARLAVIGWMVDAKDHTSHEMLTAAKSFGLPYQFSPEFYQDLVPDGGEFAQAVEEAQRARGLPLPSKVLDLCVPTIARKIH